MNINTKNTDNYGWKSEEPAAFQSLKSALIAYFGTYHSTLQAHPKTSLATATINRLEKYEIEEYKNLYFITITHLQHFFEYVLKDSLNQINPILSAEFNKDGFEQIYSTLVGNRTLEELETEKLKSIEFDEALNRLKKIKKIDPANEKISNSQNLIDNENTLKTLNLLRNRIWHKSLFFMQYHNLDLFMGKKVFPLIKKVMESSRYSDRKSWKYKLLFCEIDPIDAIIKECESETPSFERIGLLKELGRASYNNPLVMYPKGKNDSKSETIQDIFRRPFVLNSTYAYYINKDKIEESLARVNGICSNNIPFDVYECPVCGQKTLIKYEFMDFEEGVDANGNECRIDLMIPEKLHCETCSFHVEDNITDLSLIGITNSNFWKEYEL